jgi:hypothetical protein
VEDSTERNEVETYDEANRWPEKFFVPQTGAQQDSENDQDGLCDANALETDCDLARFSALMLVAFLELGSLEAQFTSEPNGEPDNRYTRAIKAERKDNGRDPSCLDKKWTEAHTNPEGAGDCQHHDSIGEAPEELSIRHQLIPLLDVPDIVEPTYSRQSLPACD